MKLLSVNVSPPKKIEYQGRTVLTGIFKEPVAGRVRVSRLNLDGDGQADLTVHGGVDMAVYVYSFDHYEHWERELNRYDFSPGQFGENFTVEGLAEDDVMIGDVLAVGSAKFQVTQPRVPCFKLGIKMQMAAFGKLFLKSLRTGFYLRVLQRGDVGAGDAIDLVERPDNSMSVRQVCHLLYFDRQNVEATQHAASLPGLPTTWRESFEARLAELL